MKEIIKELAAHLSANTYSIEYIEERLTNLCEIARLEGRKQQLDITPEIIGECITEPEQVFIKPEDMKEGEWYVIKDCESGLSYLFKHIRFDGIEYIYYSVMVNYNKEVFHDNYMHFVYEDTLRPATRSEVLKYFPKENFNDHTPINGC